MAVPQHPVTIDEFLKLPEQKPALEFEDGKVSEKIPWGAKTSMLAATITSRINHLSEPRKLALALWSVRTCFGGNSYVPDVAVYRWDRIPRDADGTISDDFLEPPDIAFEIVSQGQSVIARFRRCVWYINNGVRIALLVDPEDGSILLFRPAQSLVALKGKDQIRLDEVLDDFTLTVQELFDSLRIGSMVQRPLAGIM
jgi:Uma2 family endonuclease